MSLLAHVRRGSGDPLVLIHGIGSQRQVWEPVLDRLTPQRDVVALDLPGFGESPPAPEPELTPTDHARHVVALLDELDLETVHVAGNSLGGGVALELARAGRARSVTCLSPVGFWNDREQAYSEILLRLTFAGARVLNRRPRAAVGGPVRRALSSAHLLSRPGRMSTDEAAAALHNMATSPGADATFAGFRGWRFRDAHEIGCPVTIAWAQHDRILIPRQAGRARRALPDARHLTLRGCGHVPTWDDPEQVARVLLEGSRATPAPARSRPRGSARA